MAHFAKVSRFEKINIPLPKRATADSAGYDFTVAEDVVIPPLDFQIDKIRSEGMEGAKPRHEDYYGFLKPYTLDEIAKVTKELAAKPTLVSTGMKCYLDPGQYLEISARSSLPLKHWLIVANAEGIIDRDYADNPDNEGEIFFQFINLSPFAIQLKRGDKIGQGIIKTYTTIEDDQATGERLGGLGSTGG